MIYSCDLPSGQVLYLENQGDMTNVTVLMQQSGQQQQSGSSVMTGAWKNSPEVVATGAGAVVRVTTAAGVWSLMVQGMSLSVQSGVVEMGDRVLGLTALSQMPNVASSSFSMPPMQPMQPMSPMQPMQPMMMGGNPMQMQMGNMGMSMGGRSSSQASSQVSSSANAGANAAGNAGGNVSSNVGANTARDSPGNGSGNASGSVKFCSQCGASVKVDDRFCSSCGHSLC